MSQYPVIHTRIAWGAVFTDPVVWRSLTDHIAQLHDLGPIKTMRPGYPGSNAVFIINDAYVVKIIAPFFRQDFEREIEMYQILSKHPDLTIPSLMACGTIEAVMDWPYLIVTCLPGERLGDVWTDISFDNRLDIIAHSARWARLIHETPLTNITTLSQDRQDWTRFLQAQIAGCLSHHRSMLSESLLAQIPDYLTAAALFPDTAPLCLLHGDLTCDHILVSLRNGHWQPTGLIDFGDVETGHIEYDFVAAGLDLMAVDPAMRRTCWKYFLDSYGCQPDVRFSHRMMAYTLLHRFSDIRPWIDLLGGAAQVQSIEQLEEVLWQV
jgi:hygromycin-B 7''-O-kinase